MRSVFAADVETTGVGASDKIVELAYIRLDLDLVETGRHESLIDPEIPIPSGASAVHHITNARVECEPTIEEYMEVNDWPLMTANPSILIAHNASFDYRYLSRWMHPQSDVICTLRLAKRLFPGLDSYKLQALRYSLDLPDVQGDAHRAGADVEMMLNLVYHMLEFTGLDIEGLLEMGRKPLDIEVMPFGKHKGKELRNVPKDYVHWLLKQDNVDADLRASLEKL